MLVVLTNAQDATADYLCSKFEQAGVRFIRVDTDTLISRVSMSYNSHGPILNFDGQPYSPDQVEHVWYRRPEKLKDARFNGAAEDQYALREWSEACENFFSHIPQQRWMNHPSANAEASHKLQQLTIAAEFGLNVPDTLVTQDKNNFLAFFRKHHEQIIVKPLSTGYVERSAEENDSLIYTSLVPKEQIVRLEELAICPTFFQEFVQKEYDVRITVIDKEVHTVKLFGRDDHGNQRCDIRRYNMADVKYELTRLPVNLESAVLRVMQHYRLRFGAIDMAVDTRGRWYFLEINPNGQWAWLDLCGVTNIAQSFIRGFKESKSRTDL